MVIGLQTKSRARGAEVQQGEKSFMAGRSHRRGVKDSRAAPRQSKKRDKKKERESLTQEKVVRERESDETIAGKTAKAQGVENLKEAIVGSGAAGGVQQEHMVTGEKHKRRSDEGGGEYSGAGLELKSIWA